MSSNSDAPQVNYPDILGVISNKKRVNISVIQCVLATRSTKIPAGHQFEVILLVQNASDVDVDATITPNLPDRDAENKRGMFFTKSSRLLVGLRPAEVGYVTLPASTSPKTASHAGYSLSVDVKVEFVDKSRKPSRIRQPEGGGMVHFDHINDEIKRKILEMRLLPWSADSHGKRNHIETTFEIGPPGLASLAEFSAGWESLWTMDDYLDEDILEARVKEHLEIILPKLAVKEDMVKTLLEATIKWYETSGYSLKTAEAIYITKLLTLVLCEVGLGESFHKLDEQKKPRWYLELCRVMFQESRLRDYPDPVVKDTLYPELVNDGIMYAFKMIKTVLNEDFGSDEEMQSFADGISNALKNRQQLTFPQVYLPLIAAGVIANNRVVMERENVRETLFALHKALESHQTEQTEDNAFIIEMVNGLIDRSLDHF